MRNRYVCCNVNDTINKQRLTIVEKRSKKLFPTLKNEKLLRAHVNV